MKNSQTKKAWYKKWWIWVIIIVALAAIGGATSQNDTKNDSNNNTDKSNSSQVVTPEKEWKIISTLEGTEDNKQTDVFALKEGDVRVRYEIEGKTSTSTSMLYLLKEGTTKAQNERGELELASAIDTVIGDNEKGQKIVKQHAGNYYFEINSSGAFKYKIYIEQQE